MADPRLRRSAVLLGLMLPGFLGGCGWEPEVGELRHQLNPDSLARLEAEGVPSAASSQILSTLDAFFGTPTAPRFMVTGAWFDEGFDPNYPTYAADDGGSGEFDDDALDVVFADNERRFARELDAIGRGDYAAVGPFMWAPVLQEDWEFLMADEEFEGDALAEEARALLVEYYPPLHDSAELYRQQCSHCHGVSGGGDGPTAEFLTPRPRDYRKGVFKFTAVKDKKPPRREDLFRILTDGVYTTAMPSFKRFSLAERHGLVDYVRLLSIRGQLEERLVGTWIDEGVLTPEMATEAYTDIWERWQSAPDFVVAVEGDVPREATAEMIARGRELFMDDKKGNCFSCHGDGGRGNGASAVQYAAVLDHEGHEVLDEEGEPVLRPITDSSGNWVPLETQNDDWGNPIVPRNLTSGIFRGGDRPIDLYRRMYSGINGTQMPAIGGSLDADGNLVMTDEDIWAVVYYVYSLSEDPHHLAYAVGAAHGEVADHAEAAATDGGSGH